MSYLGVSWEEFSKSINPYVNQWEESFPIAQSLRDGRGWGKSKENNKRSEFFFQGVGGGLLCQMSDFDVQRHRKARLGG